MATTFYLPSTGSASITPAVSAFWERNGSSFTRRTMITTTTDSTLTNETHTGIGANDNCCYQYISSPLAAQTILSTRTFYIAMKGDADVASSLVITCNMRLMSSDGATERNSISWSHTSHYTTAMLNREASSATLGADWTVTSEDVLVCEIGVSRIASTAATIILDVGYNNALGILVGDGDTTGSPYVYCSQTLTFYSPSTTVYQRMMTGIG